MFKPLGCIQIPTILAVIFATILAVMPIQVAQAEIYKWVDENGKVHFSDRKEEGLGQETVELDVTASDWSRFDIDVQTPNVELTEAERANIVDGVNYVYEFFDSVLYFDFYKTVPVSILLLENREAYLQYLASINLQRFSSTYGLYSPKTNQIVVYIREERDNTFKTIRHEVSHAIMHNALPYAPAWLNEGLAEQMETINRGERGLYIEPHPINRRAVAWAHKHDKLIDIPEFLKLPSDEWRGSLGHGGTQLQSHAGQFVYFLLSTPQSRNFVTSLMHKFNRGDRTISYYIVDENYIGGVQTLDVSWSNWVKRQQGGAINLF